MKKSAISLAMKFDKNLPHEQPWIFFNRKTKKWGPCGWQPRWNAKSQSVNYIPENMISPGKDGEWLRDLWLVSRKIDEKGIVGVENLPGLPNAPDWVKVQLSPELGKSAINSE
eukprot:NODE_2731_length_478_cov_137.433566_g2153_i0.p1 GENE.NODE_2731_length_478_cov_137.433566_g2153_i0~~NODE_2731_length_478_cov_137.433566_g2153_i0.p1  ORF type:complete len:113 (+),score=17.30 NODE_2731_length_478_cov_137.433566_g2153_i0:55-393(+)